MRTTGRIVGSGKVTIPKTIRDELGLEHGDVVEFDVRTIKGEQDEERTGTTV